MEYGYVRVSTKEQNEDRQMAAMREFGIGAGGIVLVKQSGRSPSEGRRHARHQEHRPAGAELR